MKVGDLVKFSHIYNGCDLNGKIALYLGEHFIHRSDGVVVENHKVVLNGKAKPTIIDKRLILYNCKKFE